MEPIEIVKDGLLVRPWRPSDANAVHQACQDPLVARWTRVPAPYTTDHATDFVSAKSPRLWESGEAALFGVFDAGTGGLLGAMGLIRIDHETRTGELGYWTAPWGRARGVATKAGRTVAHWAFDTLRLRRLDWRAEVGNHASRLVAERMGFRLAGVLPGSLERSGGRLADGWHGTLTPDQLVHEPPAWVAPGAPGSVRAATFGRPQPVLETVTPGGAEIRLRPLEERDTEAIMVAASDPESVRWTTVPHPYQRSDADYFLAYGPRIWARAHGVAYGIAGPDDAYAGSMELRLDPNDPLGGDVGFLVAPWARGRGYASTALRALVIWGVDALAVQRVEWRAYVGNDASRRVAEKAGFVLEGVQRDRCAHRGERRDAWSAALLARDLR